MAKIAIISPTSTSLKSFFTSSINSNTSDSVATQKPNTSSFDNNFAISTNFYLISGWKDHKSQQRPLKPGEAKNKLKDFL